ncbi:hypothetical protein Tco_0975916 [Tanacetum coccineum]|uniref:Uncharacterized protein n=1 Tax=Tanacetum coccineum TaxID=301880 RepID=A0ABQ5EFQ6_9ASTR
MEECHKLLTDQVDDTILRYNVSKPLPLGGEPGHVTIQPDFFFNKDLEYLRYGRKVGRPALSNQVKKNTCFLVFEDEGGIYPDVSAMSTGALISSGLKRSASMTSQLCMVSLTGGFKDNDSTLTDSHLKETAEQEQNCVETFQLGIEVLPTIYTSPNLGMEGHYTDLEVHHDFTVIDSPRQTFLRDKITALDYRVKEFRINMTNLGKNARFWTQERDVDQSKDFMVRYPRMTKDKTNFRNLGRSFVGEGRFDKGRPTVLHKNR